MTHFLNLKDLSSNQIEEILLRASRLKKERDPTKHLEGKFFSAEISLTIQTIELKNFFLMLKI